MTPPPKATQLVLPLRTGPIAHHAEPDREVDTYKQDFTVGTWNVNSIRARLDLVIRWLKTIQPDVLCLQETKVTDDQFPQEPFAYLGYRLAVHGQKGRNGVAILARADLEAVQLGFGWEPEPEARIVTASVRGIRVASVYAPNAHSLTHHTFANKIKWMERLAEYVAVLCQQGCEVLLCGDFNVAPRDDDVHDPSLLLYETFVHRDARAALTRVTEAFVDLHLATKGRDVSYSWWDYRGDAFTRNRGMRIDHIYATCALAKCCTDVIVDVAARRAARPSDHAPLLARFDLRPMVGR